jgi:signal transduction histidine kinase
LRDVSGVHRARIALERSHAELRALSAAMETVQEQERKRIARELHDDLGQQLTALKMDAFFIRSQLSETQPDVARTAQRLEDRVGQTVQSVRRISADLRPMMLDDLGLVAALEALVARVAEHSGLTCRLVAADDLQVDAALATPLYRIAQESLNNVVKHAQATGATVSLAQDGDSGLVLKVEDDGKGMTEADQRKLKSFGLLGMRERVHAIGGVLDIVSRPMGGTVIEVRVAHPVVQPDRSGRS